MWEAPSLPDHFTLTITTGKYGEEIINKYGEIAKAY